MKFFLSFAFYLLFFLMVYAGFTQNNFTVSGYIRDSLSGEELISAAVYVPELKNGVSSNIYGFYSLTLPRGEYMFVFSYLGYKNKQVKVDLSENHKINIELVPSALQTREVEISAIQSDENIKSAEAGRLELDIEKMKSVPAIMGEIDILKSIQLLPGIQASGEGNSGFYVRGGGADQNLILLDEAVVYNSGHLFGFFSVFNADAIKNTSVIKGAMPANYGGRLSSVIDISMKEGNNKSYHADAGIGIISSRLTLEGPVVKDKSSFMISGRRTYIDVLLYPFLKGTDYEGNAYFFYDLNSKFNYRFSDKDRLFFSAYFGRDVFNYRSPEDKFNIRIPWGNATATLRWNHLFNERLFLNTSVIYNDYNFAFRTDDETYNFHIYSGIRDINYKMDFSYFPHVKHKVKYGFNYIYHTFIPGAAEFSSTEGYAFNTENLNKKYAHEWAVYFSDEMDLSEQIRINAGIRLSSFSLAPPYSDLVYDKNGKVMDTLLYSSGAGNQSYMGWEPRFHFRYILNALSSMKFSYTWANQYIHLVSNSNSTLPTDVWVPSSQKVKPQQGHQISMGYFRNFRENSFESSVEIYYKKLWNQIEYKDGYYEVPGRELEWDFVFGEGQSYGIEFFLNKKRGKTSGWFGYTLSKTTRHFEDLNTTRFPARFDRTHDLTLVLIQQATEKIIVGATFVFASGNCTTLPVRRYLIENKIVNEYGDRNSYRLEPYHRLDISVSLKGKKRSKIEENWVFSVYNAYNRKNVFFIYIDMEGNPNTGDLKIQAKKVTAFPLIPSISWNIKF